MRPGISPRVGNELRFSSDEARALLAKVAQAALAGPGGGDGMLKHALGLAVPDGGMVVAFLLHPAPRLPERYAQQHAGRAGRAPRPAVSLSKSESRVLRYLPTNLSAPEIAGELSLSVNTVRTHVRHLYEKLGTHSRTEAVDEARLLGLLA
jgi:LuxR family maltose regulon positive regulatory protein